MSKTPNSWEIDLRVRDRNIQKGILDPKDVEKYLSGLVDVGGNCDTVTVDQPAVDPVEVDEEES